MDRIKRKEVEHFISTRECFTSQGAFLCSRNGYYAVDIRNGAETLFTGTLREIDMQVRAYCAGWFDKPLQYKTGG